MIFIIMGWLMTLAIGAHHFSHNDGNSQNSAKELCRIKIQTYTSGTPDHDKSILHSDAASRLQQGFDKITDLSPVYFPKKNSKSFIFSFNYVAISALLQKNYLLQIFPSHYFW